MENRFSPAKGADCDPCCGGQAGKSNQLSVISDQEAREKQVPLVARDDKQSKSGPQRKTHPCIKQKRKDGAPGCLRSGMTLLVLDGHRFRIHCLFARDAFKSCKNASIFILVTLHRKAALCVRSSPSDSDVVLL